MDLVVADNLVKVFPSPDGSEKKAVNGLSFRVAQGQIYGLLGPNGAGKSTTLRILSGMMQPTTGRAIVAGLDTTTQRNEVKKVIGYLTANTGLYQRLSPRELLGYFADLQGIREPRRRERIDYLIQWMDMTPFADLRCGALSTGQRQRTNIARALIADPPVLILDEPTLGLDVLSNRVILDFIVRERRIGKTILLSTHYLDEAETMCDQIGLLHHGALLAEGTLQALRDQSGEKRLSNIFLKLVAA